MGKSAFLYSLILHLTLLLSCILFFSFHSKNEIINSRTENAIQASLLQKSSIDILDKNALTKANHTDNKLKNSALFQTNKNMISNSKKNSSFKTRKSIPNSIIKTETLSNSAFLELQQAIQKKQIYPEEAIDAAQEGSVTVEFILEPNGHIHHAHVYKSSNIFTLDQAGLNAVLAAEPFNMKRIHLTSPISLQIKLIFKLSD